MPNSLNPDDRIWSEALHLREVPETEREYYGPLRELQSPEGVTNSALSQFINQTNAALREAHASDPADPKSRMRWNCLMVRALLQLNKRTYLTHSAISAPRFLNACEAGEGPRRDVSKLLQEWLIMAQQLDDPEILPLVEHAREEVRQLLYWDRNDTVAGHLLGLMAKHGEDVAKVTRKTLETKLDQETAGVSPKALHGYIDDVRDFACLSSDELEKEETNTDSETHDTVRLWHHPYMCQLRRNYLLDCLESLRHKGVPAGKMELLCEYLRMLMAHADGKTGRREFVHYLSGAGEDALPLKAKDREAVARSFARNVPPASNVVEVMLDTWVVNNIIPTQAADDLLQIWRKWEQESSTEQTEGRHIGEKLEHGLKQLAQQYGFVDLFRMMKVFYPAFRKNMFTVIEAGQISNNDIPLYPALCGCYHRVRDIEHALEKLYEEHAGWPSNHGKRYSKAHWLMRIHGIKLEDIPSELRPKSVATYAEEETNPPSDDFIKYIGTLADSRACEALRKFNACFAPQTIAEAGAYPACRFENYETLCGPGKAVSEPAVFYRLAGDELENVRFKAAGKSNTKKVVYSLPKIKQLLSGTESDCTRELLIDWYLQRAAASSYPPLARSLDVIMGERCDSADEYWKTVENPSEARISIHVSGRIFTATKKGKESIKGGTLAKRMPELLDAWGQDTASPRGIFVQFVAVEQSMPKALTRWCEAMRAANRNDLLWGLQELRRNIVQPSSPTVEQRLLEKRAILERVQQGELGAVYDDTNDVVLEALKSIPGVTMQELKEWEPPFADIEPPNEVQHFTATTDALVVARVAADRVVSTIDTSHESTKSAPLSGSATDLEQELLAMLSGPRVDVESQRFNRWFAAMVDLFGQVFPEEHYPGANRFICTDPEEFRTLLATTPDLIREFAVELASLCIDQRESGKGFNGKKPYRHQEAYWFAMVCCCAKGLEGGLSFLLDASAGCGKTLMQGVCAAAFRNGQRRGVIDPSLKIVYITSKEAFENQQLMDEQARYAVVFSTNPEHIGWRERRDHYRFVREQLQTITSEDDVSPYMPAETAFSALYDNLPSNPKAAKKTLQALLAAEGKQLAWADAVTETDIEEQVLKLLSRCGTVVIAPDQCTLQYLDCTRSNAEVSLKRAIATGDITFGLEEANMYLRRDARKANDIDPETYDVVCLSYTAVAQSAFQKQYAELLQGGLYLLDEAQNTTGGFFRQLAEAGGVDDYIALAATAKDQGPKSSGLGGFSRFNVQLPHFKETDAINGPDKVSKPATMMLFPGKDDVHFPSGTYEHAEQLVSEYGRMLQLPLQKDQGRKTLGEGLHIITVPRDLVAYVTLRLQQEYEHTGIDFISYTANRLVPQSEKYERINRMQAIMCDGGHQRRCLVGTMDDFRDSLDPRHATGVIMSVCVHTDDTIPRYYGRGNHSVVPGWLFAQHRLAHGPSYNKTVPKTYPPELERNPMPTNHGEHWTVVDGQTMWGHEEVVRDEERILREHYPTRSIIPTKKTSDPLPVPSSEGEMPVGNLEAQIEAGHTNWEWVQRKGKEVRSKMSNLGK